MNNCNLDKFKPIPLQYIDARNTNPGDIIEIDFVYTDGLESNITVDNGYDPLSISNITNQLAFNSLISSSLNNSFSNYIETSIIPSKDECVWFWLVCRDACYAAQNFVLKDIPTQVYNFLLQRINQQFHNITITDSLISRFGIRNSQLVSPVTILELVAILHEMQLITIPLYSPNSKIEFFENFTVTFHSPTPIVDVYTTSLGPNAPNTNDQYKLNLFYRNTDSSIFIKETFIDYGAVPATYTTSSFTVPLLSDSQLRQQFVDKVIESIAVQIDEQYDDHIRPIRHEINPVELKTQDNNIDFYTALGLITGAVLSKSNDISITIDRLSNLVIKELYSALESPIIHEYGAVMSPFSKFYGMVLSPSFKLQLDQILITFVRYNVIPTSPIPGNDPTLITINPSALDPNFFSNVYNAVSILVNNGLLLSPTQTQFTIASIPNDEKIIWIKILLYYGSKPNIFGIDRDAILTIFSTEEQSLIDDDYIRNVFETFVKNSFMTCVTPTGVHFTNTDFIDGYPSFNFDRLQFYWNVPFTWMLSAIDNQINLTNLSNLLTPSLSNFELPGRFEIQKLTSFIKRFQLSNYGEDDLPVYELWNVVDDQEFCSYGSVDTSYTLVSQSDSRTIHTGKFGKIVVEILPNNQTCDLRHLVDPNVFKYSTFKLNNLPYVHPLSSSYMETLRHWNSVLRSFSPTDPVRLTLDPNANNGGVFRTIGMVYNNQLLYAPETPVGFYDSGSFVFSHSYFAQLFGLQFNFTSNSRYDFINASSGSFTVDSNSSYNMIPYKPLFQVSYDGKSIVDYVNFTQSNATSAQGPDSIHSFTRNERFSNYSHAPLDGFQSVVYRIRKWPRIFDQNQHDITVDLLKNFNRYIHGLKLINFTESIKQSYLIDDNRHGYTTNNISDTFVDLQGNLLDISSSFNIHRNAAFSNSSSFYAGGLSVNRPLQTFSHITYDKKILASVQPTGSQSNYARSGYKINFKGFGNIIPSDFTADILSSQECLIDNRFDPAEYIVINDLIQNYRLFQDGNLGIFCNPVFYNFLFTLTETIKTAPSGTVSSNVESFVNTRVQFPLICLSTEQFDRQIQMNKLTNESASLLNEFFWSPTLTNLSTKFNSKSFLLEK